MAADDALLVRHMIDTARKVTNRMEGVSRAEFDADEDLRDAIAHRIQIIGEAASRISPEFRTSHPEIPWKRITGMRHYIVHDYMNVDFDTVWVVATRNLYELIPALQALNV